MNSYFVLGRQDSELYAVLNKVINLVPTSAVNAALASNSYGEQQITFARFIRENMGTVLGGLGLVLAVIAALLLRSLRSEKKTREAMGRIAELNEEQKKRLDEIAELNTKLSDNQQKLKEALETSEQASRAKTSFLSNMSHEIRTPMNGSSVWTTSRCAILMDVRMPVMNGLEAMRTIRALDRPDAKEIPIIAMTANAFDEDVQTSLQAGMDAHLSKPVEPEKLYQTLGQMLRRG